VYCQHLATLLEAAAATVGDRRRTLTDVGGRFGGGTGMRNEIKRAYRLLDNGRLQRNARPIDAALARKLLAGWLSR